MLLQSSKFIGAGLLGTGSKRGMWLKTVVGPMVWRDGVIPPITRIPIAYREENFSFRISDMRRLTGAPDEYLDDIIGPIEGAKFDRLLPTQQLSHRLEEHDALLKLIWEEGLQGTIAEPIRNDWFYFLNLHSNQIDANLIPLKLHVLKPITGFLIEICSPYL